MKKTLKFIILLTFLGSFCNEINAQQCQVPELVGGWYYGNVEGAGTTITRQISFSPSTCIAFDLEFTQVPDWITITMPTPYSVQIVVAVNTTAVARSSPTMIVYEQGNQSNSLGIIIINQNGCTNWYPDTDGDGYGDLHGEPVVSCDSQISPIPGYVSNNDDACPTNANNTINGCESGYVHEDRNWTYGEAYDISGVLKTKSKSYFDDLGKGEQTQTLDIETGKIWATQSLYDAQGRPAFQSLSAPINNTGTIGFNPDFIKNSSGINYTTSDFESNPENPSTVGTAANTLGHYYSDNNTDANYQGNSYQDVTDYPFSRTIYSELNPGAALKSVGGNKVDHDNDPNTPEIWLQGYTFSMRASRELSQTDVFNDDAYNDYEIIKTVSRDVHGVETVVFTDTDGKTLAAARSGDPTVSRDMWFDIGPQGFVDVHVPKNIQGIAGFTIINNQPGVNLEVYDLITEQLVIGATSNLPNGFYRVVVTNLEEYDPNNIPITVNYKENYYDYSLNEYDETGRLIASYQPLAKLKSEFQYDALGQLIYSKSPDEGEAWFKYRQDGQIRFSQNSKQALVNEFSYTHYDNLGRPVESGVFTENSTFIFNPNNDNALDNIIENVYTFEEYKNDLDDLPNINCKEQQFSMYDAQDIQGFDDAMETLIMGGWPEQRFLAGKVSKTYNDNATTWYSYDIYGRVEWMVQDIAGLGVKTIDYAYHPITGNILEVDYQKHIKSERFVHHYEYNSVDQLIAVKTSTDGNLSTASPQALYEYYETGAVSRMELAENLQGIDYVYNLAGQLKAINHPSSDANEDPGKDGVSNEFSPDVFSMSLDYYKEDYSRANTPTPINSITEGTDQFNGNIKAMTWYTKHPNSTPIAQTYYYGYNKNNWLESAGLGAPIDGTGAAQDHITKSEVITNNQDIVARQSITLLPNFHVQSGTLFTAKIDPNAQGADTGDYNVSNITYDANGNIQSLNRNKQSENGANAMDQLSYSYKQDKPNQLDHVADAVTGTTNANDIKTQNSGNYIYNSIGQLIEDFENVSLSEKQTYEAGGTIPVNLIRYVYNTNGLVTDVLKGAHPIVKFYYNDKGHRVRKESFDTNGNLTYTEHHVRDALGNSLAIYRNGSQTEIPVYGNSRIGVYYKSNNRYRYQLTDHLGNVRAVVEKADPTPKATTDYYPFGMIMPGKVTQDGITYRFAYQGQEKDQETGKEAFQLRLWDGRIGRWLTADPYGQFNSPYLGMGNNPINGVDPDGGCWINGEKCKDGKMGDIQIGDSGAIWLYGANGWDTGAFDEYEVSLIKETILSEDQTLDYTYGEPIMNEFDPMSAKDRHISISGFFRKTPGIVLELSSPFRMVNTEKNGNNIWDQDPVLIGFGGKFKGIKGSGFGKFRGFNKANYRYNLKILTGKSGKGFDAHHMFAQHFDDFFKSKNINIHHAEYMQWWELSSHRKHAKAVNRDWILWINNQGHKASRKKVIEFGEYLLKKYGL